METYAPGSVTPADDKVTPSEVEDTGTVEVEETGETEEQAPEQEQQEAAEKLYANKYKSPEDLEKAYISLQSKIGQRANELSELRTSNQQLSEQVSKIAQMYEQQQQQEAAPAVDYNEQANQIYKAVDTGEIELGEGLRRLDEIRQNQYAEISKNQGEAVLTEMQAAYQADLRARDEQKMIDEFHKKEPRFREFAESGAMEELMSSNPMHNELSAYYEWKAQQAFEDGRKQEEKVRSGSAPAKRVSGAPGSAIKDVPQKQQSNLSKTELHNSMLQAALSAGK